MREISSMIITVKSDYLPEFLISWDERGDGWHAEVIDVNEKEATVRCYFWARDLLTAKEVSVRMGDVLK